MSDKEVDRSRRERRRGQQSREKEARRAAQARTANLDSKAKNKKENIDLKIVKLTDKGYSIAFYRRPVLAIFKRGIDTENSRQRALRSKG